MQILHLQLLCFVWHERSCSPSSGSRCRHWAVLHIHRWRCETGVSDFYPLGWICFSVLDFCLALDAGWAVSSAAHHGRARPRHNLLWRRAAPRSSGDTWHQYVRSRAQTSGHAPRTTRHRQGPYAGWHRGAFRHLGESLSFFLLLNRTFHYRTVAKKHFPDSSCSLVTGWHGNCMLNETGWILVMSGFLQFIVGYSISAHSFLISQSVSNLLYSCRYYYTTIILLLPGFSKRSSRARGGPWKYFMPPLDDKERMHDSTAHSWRVHAHAMMLHDWTRPRERSRAKHPCS